MRLTVRKQGLRGHAPHPTRVPLSTTYPAFSIPQAVKLNCHVIYHRLYMLIGPHCSGKLLFCVREREEERPLAEAVQRRMPILGGAKTKRREKELT